ncbi:MAG TPA: mannitol dehydrogenase family protein [Clostridia bacterium]|nr:mannitol dehydrogenase family protein [Clostridia bacterium]
MKLYLETLKSGAFAGKGYDLPAFDVETMVRRTKAAPIWLHFGAGNILRAFPCVLCQRLLDAGAVETGMIVVETYDEEIIDKAFAPFDNLSVAVSLKGDGGMDKRVVASVAEALGYCGRAERVREIFTSDSLQLVSMTITEKGYAVADASGKPLPYCAGDFESMEAPVSAMGILAKLLYARYRAGAKPLAMVSLDNCSHNGAILAQGVRTIADAWLQKGLVDAGFLSYLEDESKVAFPWTMIDKITPRPAEAVLSLLEADGLEGAAVTVTAKHTYVSCMVNAEECEYLAIEDAFPNGRPPLERVGVIFGSRETVERIERMKVCTCLNPLHTCLAIFGCLLGHVKISEEMKDTTLRELIERIGWDEGLPVVTDPGVMSASKFLEEVLTLRLPNPFVPDTPQRIACDTSKKLSVRFGETLKAYLAKGESDLSFLTFIPLVFAGYARYLTGIGDDGKVFELSPDPNLSSLTPLLGGFVLGKPFDPARLHPLFANAELWGVDLYACGLGEKAETLFAEMNQGPGAIRAALDRCLRENK